MSRPPFRMQQTRRREGTRTWQSPATGQAPYDVTDGQQLTAGWLFSTGACAALTGPSACALRARFLYTLPLHVCTPADGVSCATHCARHTLRPVQRQRALSTHRVVSLGAEAEAEVAAGGRPCILAYCNRHSELGLRA